MPHVLRPVALLAALTALLLLLAVPAQANHRQQSGPSYYDDPSGYEQPAEDPGDPFPGEEEFPSEVDPPAPVVEPPAPVTEWPGPDPVLPPVLPAVNETIVKGTLARMRTDGKAAVPRSAPKVVRTIIRAANQIIGKPYVWGGGHRKLVDRGYDCSGAVSYALIKAGLLRSPMVSGQLAKTYAAGAGKYVSVYAHSGHVYMEVAGLRLDTSAVGDRGGRSGVRWRPVIGKRPGFKTRHPIGL